MTSERRVAPRRGAGPAAVEVYGGRRTAGEIVDRSAGGLALVTGLRVKVGERLRVRPATEPDAPWAEVEVRHRRPGAGGWLVGCRYAAGPPASSAGALARSCTVLRLPLEMPAWFRAFATARLADVDPAAVATVRSMADADLRRFYAAVRAAGAVIG